MPPSNRAEEVQATVRALQADARAIEHALALRPAARSRALIVWGLLALALVLWLQAVASDHAEASVWFVLGSGLGVLGAIAVMVLWPHADQDDPGARDFPLSPRAIAWIKRHASTHAYAGLAALAMQDSGTVCARHARAYLEQLEQAIRRRTPEAEFAAR